MVYFKNASHSIELLSINNGCSFRYLFNREGLYFYLFKNFGDLIKYLNFGKRTWCYFSEDESRIFNLK
jgi:hypothetical protein